MAWTPRCGAPARAYARPPRRPQPRPNTRNGILRAGPLPADQRHRDQARGEELVQERSEGEGPSLLARAIRQQALHERLAGEVGRAVARLAQVEVLLEPDEVAIG